jgi:D-alanine-D-alanine ligase
MKNQKPVAVLHQGHVPPAVDGIRKPLKPNGYADSSADIAFTLKKAGVPLVTLVDSPNPTQDLDWSFPDTTEGIENAQRRGAQVLWANTVLYVGHPLEVALKDGVAVVGQNPANVGRFDDKFYTNSLLRDAGLPLPASVIIGDYPQSVLPDWQAVTLALLQEHGLTFPLIIKPIRGRGSAGVEKVETWDALHAALNEFFTATETVGEEQFSRYGSAVLVEEYLAGDEVTISVLPPEQERTTPRALPPVLRFNHRNGIAPYNGVVAVTQNSRALSPDEIDSKLQALCAACETAAALVEARMVIRIDCRQDVSGAWKLFDLNMKPNLTGAGRPGREDQDSLTTMAAAAIDCDYETLLLALLDSAWTV